MDSPGRTIFTIIVTPRDEKTVEHGDVDTWQDVFDTNHSINSAAYLTFTVQVRHIDSPVNIVTPITISAPSAAVAALDAVTRSFTQPLPAHIDDCGQGADGTQTFRVTLEPTSRVVAGKSVWDTPVWLAGETN